MNTDNFINQLEEWYETAEQVTKTNLPSAGDTIIYPDGSGYKIEPAGEGWAENIVYTDGKEPTRILHRAPAPTPAWHDAVAVIASTDKNGPQVWERCGGHWDGTAGDEALDSDLRDVTPLIEQKVTDEMVLRALQARSTFFGHDPADQIDAYTSDVVEYTRAGLRAALGIAPS